VKWLKRVPGRFEPQITKIHGYNSHCRKYSIYKVKVKVFSIFHVETLRVHEFLRNMRILDLKTIGT
jgi:hypothetical protein